jgi:hypothetical protein
VLACAMAKLYEERHNNEIQKIDHDLDPVISACDQLSLITHLYTLILKENPSFIRKDTVEVILNFVDDHYEEVAPSL